MAFEATKREWCELYTFFRLLTEGKVTLGTAKAKKGEIDWPIAMIQREEHDGTRCYYIEKEMVRIKGENSEKSVPREDFGIVADLILQAVKSSSEDEVTSPDGVEEFLDEVAIFDLEAKTEDRTDFYIAFWHPEAPLSGFSVRSRLGAMNPLLDGGRAANLKLEQSGVKFATPTVNKINALPEAPNEVAERMLPRGAPRFTSSPAPLWGWPPAPGLRTRPSASPARPPCSKSWRGFCWGPCSSGCWIGGSPWSCPRRLWGALCATARWSLPPSASSPCSSKKCVSKLPKQLMGKDNNHGNSNHRHRKIPARPGRHQRRPGADRGHQR